MSWVLDDEVLAVIAAIIIVSTVIAVVQVINVGRVVEPFSALGILGPSGKIGDYPRQVVAGVPFKLNIYVGNYEGKTMYYRILIKLSDNSSIINETTPLLVEPLMEVRVILAHNSSQVIPVNITLNRSVINARLAFEMWVFNESIRSFTYHGRWNHLWINVTEPPLGSVVPPKQVTMLSPELEDKIVEGYLAVRRVESVGGNVSEMISLLNRAIGLALASQQDEAEAHIKQVMIIEPEAYRVGLEVSRIRTYVNIGTLVSICVIGVGAYILLRQRIWGYWARFYSNWLVRWSSSNSGLNTLEKNLKDYITSKNSATVGDVVFSWGVKYGSYEVAKTLFKLIRYGAVKLVDPNPPNTFIRYLLSRYNLSFTITTLIVVLCLITIYFSNLSIFITGLRIALGTIFTLFLPGYALIEVLYPSGEDLKPIERLALSIGLSLALVPLIGLILNYTPWGIRLNSVVVTLSILTLGLMLISSYRKFCIHRLRIVRV